jgi:hypothetical protein
MNATCSCGRVEIELDAVAPVGLHCYCTICRKITGGAHSTTVRARREAFRVVRGADDLARYQATPGVDRWHCATCHAPIFSEEPGRPEWGVFVPAGLLDPEAIGHLVFDHIFVAERPRWHRIRDDRPQHDGLPPRPV